MLEIYLFVALSMSAALKIDIEFVPVRSEFMTKRTDQLCHQLVE